MSIKGLFTKDEREFLIREVDRISSLQGVDPLKPEEARFIREVLKEIREKDPREIDMMKVKKALEILDRWALEETSEDSLRAWLYMYILKRILERERGELFKYD